MNAVEFEVHLKDLEVRLDQLKALYDQYFQGMERLPPVRKRASVERALKEIRRDQPRNTAARFRFQTLWQRWITLTTHWDRVSRQIEEGTYKRDVLRARRRREGLAAAKPKANGAVEIDVDLDDYDLDAEIGAALDGLRDEPTDPEVRLPPEPRAAMPMAEAPRAMPAARPAPAAPSPAAPSPVATFSRPKEASFRRPTESTPPQVGAPRATAERTVPPPSAAPRQGGERTSLPAPPPAPARPPVGALPRRPSASPELGERELRRIHAQYVAAGGGTMPYEKLAARIKSMEPELKKKHGGKSIDFEVVVKDGRVGLKPVTRE